MIHFLKPLLFPNYFSRPVLILRAVIWFEKSGIWERGRIISSRSSNTIPCGELESWAHILPGMKFLLLPSSPLKPARVCAVAQERDLREPQDKGLQQHPREREQRSARGHKCILVSVALCLQSSCGLSEQGTGNYYFKRCCSRERNTKSQWTIDTSHVFGHWARLEELYTVF